jgi:perosamine synthetase
LIPRFKPYLGREELLAAIRPQENAVVRFENEFARTFEAKHAIAFPYGRSGLWAFFKALEIEGAEVIMPAYTCVVVAHAIVLSDNIPRFVDITLYDYNMDLDQVERMINERTQAIIATHLFGYPLNVDRLSEMVRIAETRWGHKIWIVQDCAHSFGARWRGKLVCNEADAALFGFNISKTITSIFGGMITTNDSKLYEKLRAFRDKHFPKPKLLKRIRRMFYLLAIYPAFNKHVYGLVNWLEEETKLLDRLTKAYHLDERIHFPPDHLDQMLNIEAKVGSVQLRKYPEIVRQRQENAFYYDQHLRDIPCIELPPLVEGATYSHYVVRVPNRKAVVAAMRLRGIQLGQLIEYSIPHMQAYTSYVSEHPSFPASLRFSRTTVNLPNYPGLSDRDMSTIIAGLRACNKSQSLSRRGNH